MRPHPLRPLLLVTAIALAGCPNVDDEKAGQSSTATEMMENPEYEAFGQREAGEAAEPPDRTLVGRVLSTDGETVTIQTGDRGRIVTLERTDETQVLSDGRPSNEDEIQAGAEVRASYEEEFGRNPSALRIEVLRRGDGSQQPIELAPNDEPGR